MASTTTRLMTFAEFEQLPRTPRGFPYELRLGELVELAETTIEHQRKQRHIRRLLEQAAGEDWVVATEVGFRGLPEVEYRVADVALLSSARWENAVKQLFGVPELVIEVLSPSNTTAEIRDKRKLCLENGAREFWVVDMDHREVEVSTPDGHAVTYKSGQSIPLFFAPGASLAVDAVFS